VTQVTVAALRVDKPQFANIAGDHLTDFANAVQTAQPLLANASGGTGLKVFVAPEYYFNEYASLGRTHKSLTPVAHTRKEKHDIYAGLKRISQQAGNTLIIAGTIFYEKGKGTKRKGLSVCPVLQNGKILHKYYKTDDDGSLARQSDGTYDWKPTDPYFNAGGVRFGLEVCMEHSNGVLGAWLTAHNNKTVDVQVLISDGNFPTAPMMKAKSGGYFIHCDLAGQAAAAVKIFTTGTDWNIKNRTEVAVSQASPLLADGSKIEVFAPFTV
jgi:predicted amidohydrolase